MTHLTSRFEFRAILKGVINCLRDGLDRPGIPQLTPEEIRLWLREVTMDDIRVVIAQMECRAKKEVA